MLDSWFDRVSASAMPWKAPQMSIFVTIMFLLPVGLVTLYFYVFGVFTNRKAFQFTFYILLGFFVTDHRNWHSTFLPWLQPPGINHGGTE